MQDNIEYDDIFKDHRKQKQITALFKTLIEIRKKLLEEKQSNPSTIDVVLGNSNDVLDCIDNYSSGK